MPSSYPCDSRLVAQEQNPAWVTYLSPFRLVVPDDEDPLEVSLDEINDNSYSHGKLSRIVEQLPTPLGSEWPMFVCYDGAFAVPKTADFTKKEVAIDYYNAVFCNLFLGGILCGSIDTRDVVWGQLYRKRLIWPVAYGGSVCSHLHAGLKTLCAGPLELMQLDNPPVLRVSRLREAFLAGLEITEALTTFSPRFFLLGITELRNRNWSSALSHLWISVEQLTEHLWNSQFLGNSARHPIKDIPKRKEALKDNRTWSIAVKLEVLFQCGVLSENALAFLFPARQARNRLVHDGNDVEQKAALSACHGVISLLAHCTGTPVDIDESMFVSQDDASIHDIDTSREPNFEDWNSISAP